MRVLIETHEDGHAHFERELAGDDDVETMLAELDGFDDATLSVARGSMLTEAAVIVGRTPAGYLVTWCRDGDFHQLVGAPGQTGETELILGGEPTPTPNRWLVGRDDLSGALGRYVRDATFPDDLLWEIPE